MMGLERALVLVGTPARLDAGGGQHVAVERRVEAQAAGQHVAEPPLVPADVGLGRLADHQVGPHRPADLLEMVPALAGRMPRHGAVDDLDRGPARAPRALVPVALQDRLEPLVDVDAPARADRVAHQRDPERPGGLVDGVLAVAHPLGVGAPARRPSARRRRTA